MTDEKVKELIRLINTFSENINIQNAIDDQVYDIMEDYRFTQKEMIDFWHFYQEYDNFIQDEHGEVVSYKDFPVK